MGFWDCRDKDEPAVKRKMVSFVLLDMIIKLTDTHLSRTWRAWSRALRQTFWQILATVNWGWPTRWESMMLRFLSSGGSIVGASGWWRVELRRNCGLRNWAETQQPRTLELPAKQSTTSCLIPSTCPTVRKDRTSFSFVRSVPTPRLQYTSDYVSKDVQADAAHDASSSGRSIEVLPGRVICN